MDISGAVITFNQNTINGLIINNNNKTTIHSNTIGSNITVSKGELYIFDGGIVTSSIINSACNLYVNSGASAIKVNSKTGANIAVSEGGYITYVVEDLPSSGSLDTNTIYEEVKISSGVSLIASNTSVTELNVNAGGKTFIESGAVINSTIISSGGSVNISSGAIVSSVDLATSARLRTYGGTINSLSVSSGANLGLRSGTTALNVDIELGAKYYLYIAYDTLISGKINGSNFVISSALHDFTLNSGGTLMIDEGGSMTNNIINDGAVGMQPNLQHILVSGNIFMGGKLQVSRGCLINANTFSAGNLIVQGSANDIVMSGGMVALGSESVISNITINNEAIFSAFINSNNVINGKLRGSNIDIRNGQINNLSITSIDEIKVSSGCVVNNLYADGGVFQFNGCSGSNINLNNNLKAYKYTFNSNASFSDVKISNCSVHLSYGTINNCSMNNGGVMLINSQGKCNTITLNSGCVLYLYSGATATNVISNVGANIKSSAGCVYTLFTAPIIYSSGGVMVDYFNSSSTLSNKTINNSEVYYVKNGATLNSVNISSGGSLSLNGSADYITLTSGGKLIVSSGGKATNVIYNEGCIIVQEDGGTVSYLVNETITGQTVLTVNGTYGNLNVNSGGDLKACSATVSSLVVNTGGKVSAYDGAVINSVTNSGGTLHIMSTVSSVGTINVSSGGSNFIWDNANVTSVVLNGGNVANYGSVSNITVNSGTLDFSRNGTAGNTVASGGTVRVRNNVNNITTYNYATVYIYSPSICSNCTVNGGMFKVSSGASIINTTINTRFIQMFDGCYADKITINSGGSLLYYGGTLNTYTLNTGGTICVYSNASFNDRNIVSGIVNVYKECNNIIVSNGGNLNLGNTGICSNVTVGQNGNMKIYSGGSTNIVNINNNGNVSVINGAIINSVTVQSGGTLTVAGTASHITFYDGGVINSKTGATISYDKIIRTIAHPPLTFNMTKFTYISYATPSSQTKIVLSLSCDSKLIQYDSNGYTATYYGIPSNSIDGLIQIYFNGDDEISNPTGGVIHINGGKQMTYVYSDISQNNWYKECADADSRLHQSDFREAFALDDIYVKTYS